MRALKAIGFVLMLLIASSASSQQVYQFSQYLQNLYILNTATAGVNDYTDVSMSYRKQWVGIENSPSTYYVSANTALGKKFEVNARQSSLRISSPETYDQLDPKSFHAIGGYLANDVYGAYGLMMAGVSYAFHLPISKSHTISFSPSVSYTNARFDQNRAQVDIDNDPTYANYVAQNGNSQRMDVNIAFWFYHEKYFIGYSSDQLMQDRLALTDQISFEEISTYHNMMAGYHFSLRKGMTLTPSVLAAYNSLTGIRADVNLRLDFQDRMWGGIAYRSGNNAIIMAGLHVSNTIRVGYSFDYAFSSLSRYQNLGTHEVMLGLNLFSKEKAVF